MAAAEGFGILAAEYRGYSGGPGKPSAVGLAQDARAFLAQARLLAAGRKVWIVGHSLGGAVALDLARGERLDQVVTIGAFTSLKDMAGGVQRAFVPNDYRNDAIVPLLDEPLAIVHGLRDEVVPWTMGQELHKLAVVGRKSGRSYILLQETHTPDGTLVTAILRDILEQYSGQPPLALANVKVVPFAE